MRSSHLVLALLSVPLVATAGCGEPSNAVWVTGKLLKGGAEYLPPKGQFVYVTFVGLEIQDSSGKTIQSGDPYWADVDQAHGTFSVPGPEGRGIPRGRYRVAVTQKMERTAYDAAKPSRPKKGVDRETDLLGNRFGLVHSPIIREIKSSCNLEIDLDQPAEKVASPGTAGVASDGQEVGSLSAPRSRPRTSRD